MAEGVPVFDGNHGYWRHKGRAFTQLSLWRWPVMLWGARYGDEDNLRFLQELSRSGFTTTDVWFIGRWLGTGSGWDFSDHDRHVEAARKLGLVVIPTIDISANRMPRAMIEARDWHIVTEEGQKIPLIDDLGPQLVDSYVLQNLPLLEQSYAEVAKDFVQSIIAHYRNDDAIGYWNIMGELWGYKPYLKPGVGLMETGYDVTTRAALRKWLGKRYSLEALAARWGAKGYGGWEDVEPPVGRKQEDFAGRPLSDWKAAWWDWHSFKLEVCTGFLRRAFGWIRELDGRPTVVEYNNGMTGSYCQFNREARWNLLAGAHDAVSHLAVQAFERNARNQIYYLCMARGASRPPHQLNEISAGVAQLLAEGYSPREGDAVRLFRRLFWLSQALGATGACCEGFPDAHLLRKDAKGHPWFAEESAESRAERKRVLAEIDTIVSQVKACGGTLAASFPEAPRIGFLVLDESTLRESGRAIELAKPMMRLLVNRGYAGDIAIVTERHILEDRLKDYRMVIAPSAPSIRTVVAEGLEQYVLKGGFLVIGPQAGRYNEYGDPYGGLCPPLRRCAGVRARPVFRVERDTHDFLSSRDFHRVISCTLRASRLEELELESPRAEVLIHYNWQAREPAVTLHPYGDGTCCYLGCEIVPDAEERTLENFLLSLALEAGIQPAVTLSDERGDWPEGVIAGQRRTAAGSRLFVLVEMGNQHHAFRIALNRQRLGLKPGMVAVKRLAGAGSLGTADAAGAVDASLGPAEVMIVEVE